MGHAVDALTKLGMIPTELGLDLLILAAHVHAADTRISRTSESQDSWTREIGLIVPVLDVAVWEKAATILVKMLNFLTGDRWTLGFRPRPNSLEKLLSSPEKKKKPAACDCVALFSGGLDSLIGAIEILEGGQTPLLVSHYGDGATSTPQNKLRAALDAHYAKANIPHLSMWMAFPNNFIKGVSREDTTRGRSFLFFALGIFAGTALQRTFTLKLAENGLIALNVPLDPLRLGSLSTHTTHPFYIARWNELLVTLAIPGTIENPYGHRTKGEMISKCSNKGLLKKLYLDSLSCSSPTKGRWQGIGSQHCGFCLPCLIRRAALQRGFGKNSDKTVYTLKNLETDTLDSLSSRGQQIRSLQFASERLRKRKDLAGLFIHKSGPLEDVRDQWTQLAGVYERGLKEVAALLAKVKARPM